MAAKKRMIQIQQEENESESKVESEEKYNLTTPELEDKLKYDENYEVNVEKDGVNSEVYKTEDEELVFKIKEIDEDKLSLCLIHGNFNHLLMPIVSKDDNEEE